MKVQISSFLLLLIGVTVAFPTKDREIDELIFRLQELKHQNGASKQTPGSIGPRTPTNVATQQLQQYPKNRKPVDIDFAPLLYDYYATGIAPSLDEYNNQKRFDEIDRFGFDTFKRQIGNMRPTQYIDKSGVHPDQQSEKRASHSIKSRGYGRGFDEIDRINFGDFY